jgi:hypothetical protein
MDLHGVVSWYAEMAGAYSFAHRDGSPPASRATMPASSHRRLLQFLLNAQDFLIHHARAGEPAPDRAPLNPLRTPSVHLRPGSGGQPRVDALVLVAVNNHTGMNRVAFLDDGLGKTLLAKIHKASAAQGLPMVAEIQVTRPHRVELAIIDGQGQLRY